MSKLRKILRILFGRRPRAPRVFAVQSGPDSMTVFWFRTGGPPVDKWEVSVSS